MSNASDTLAHQAPPPSGMQPKHVGHEEPPQEDPKRRRKLIILIVVLVLAMLLAGIFGWYLIFRKPLSQLPGIPSGAAPHYLYSAYGVERPLGVAANTAGDRIYVTQSDGARDVQVLDDSGHTIGSLKPPADSGESHVPVYIAVNPTNDDVYVSDRMTNDIYVYDADGTYSHAVDPTEAGLSGSWAPLGLAFSSDGSLYVTDVGKHQRVVVISPDGDSSRTFGEEDGLSFPNGIAVDDRGNVAVADSNNSRLLVYGPDGTIAATVSPGTGEGSLGLPRGVAFGDDQRLYVVDTMDHMVRVYELGDPGGFTPAYAVSFGTEGSADGSFEYPNDVALDSHGRVYITDRENMRLQVWSY